MKFLNVEYIFIFVLSVSNIASIEVSNHFRANLSQTKDNGDITFTNTMQDLFAYSHYLSHVLAYDTSSTDTITAFGNKVQVIYATKEIKSKPINGVNYEGRVIIGKSKRMNNVLVIVFRGTDNKCNGIEDARISKTALTNKSHKEFKDAKVHEGFMNVYRSVREEVRSSVLDMLKKNKQIDSIFITGHSLGGALANLCVVDMDFYYNKGEGKSMFPNGIDLNLVTFGAPRVGDQVLVKYMKEISKLRRNLRVAFQEDIVTQIPVTDDFVHGGTLAVFDGKNWDLKEFQVDKSPRLSVADKFLDFQGLSSWAENFIDLISCNTSVPETLNKMFKKTSAKHVWQVIKTGFKGVTSLFFSEDRADMKKLVEMGKNHSKYKTILPSQMLKLNELYLAASAKAGKAIKKNTFRKRK